MLEKTLESPLECKEIQLVHSEGYQPWDFFGRNDAKADTPVLWPPHVKSWLIGKDSDAGRDWRQEEKGTTEDEMAGWHYWLDGHEFAWTPRVGDGQGGLSMLQFMGVAKSQTELSDWTELIVTWYPIRIFGIEGISSTVFEWHGKSLVKYFFKEHWHWKWIKPIIGVLHL